VTEQAEVTVATVNARPIAVVAARTTWRDFPTQWKPMLDEVYACFRRHDSPKQGCNVMFYKDDVPNIEVGVELIAPCVLDGPVIRSALPSGEIAMTVHRGPYQDLGVAYDRLQRWCDDSGRAFAGPRWEVYGDWRENEAELKTEVYYLLR
jgi:effector-binding domain-containing protein